MLATRIVSALVFAPALFWVVWKGGVYLEGACAVIALLMLWEYLRMTAPSTERWLRGLGYGLGLVLVAALYGWFPGAGSKALLPMGAMLLWIVALGRPVPIEDSVKRVALVGFGVVYCCSLLPFLGLLRSMGHHGLGLSVLALFATWGADTCAYFAGRALGKHPLYPIISPKKTIEGAVGGVAGAVAVAFLVSEIEVLGLSVPAHHLVGMGVCAALLGMVGDLAASMLKRSTGTKDSSALIPGHGGLLDRFDGVMFSAPALYTYATLFLV